MRGCASKTGTGRIVMIITIRQLNPLLAASFSPFWAVPERGCHRGMSGYKTNKYILLYESRETVEEKSLSILSLLKQRVSLNLSYYDI